MIFKKKKHRHGGDSGGGQPGHYVKGSCYWRRESPVGSEPWGLAAEPQGKLMSSPTGGAQEAPATGEARRQPHVSPSGGGKDGEG